MAGTTDLNRMLATLEPRVRDGVYVFVTDPGGSSTPLEPEAVVQEDEGRTLVVRREVADEAGLVYDFEASWITLTVQSSLDDVGLTAAFSTALADAGISCNVLAATHHDHILVPHTQRKAAVTALRALSDQHR